MNFENYMLDLSTDEIFLEKELKLDLLSALEEIDHLEVITAQKDIWTD